MEQVLYRLTPFPRWPHFTEQSWRSSTSRFASLVALPNLLAQALPMTPHDSLSFKPPLEGGGRADVAGLRERMSSDSLNPCASTRQSHLHLRMIYLP